MTKKAAQEGIINLGSSDFLTPEGKPIWDFLSPKKPTMTDEDFSYSDGFSQIRWRGTEYSLTPLQARAVSLLLDAYEDGLPEIHQNRILERIGSRSKRLEHLFKKSPLWGTLIVPGSRKGSFQLKI